MRHHISDESLKATTHCEKAFSCLEEDRNGLCEVEHCVSETVHFIKRLNDLSCFYQQPFGSGHFCACPTRKELFNRYKI